MFTGEMSKLCSPVWGLGKPEPPLSYLPSFPSADIRWMGFSPPEGWNLLGEK